MEKKLILCVLCFTFFLTACSNNRKPDSLENAASNSSFSEKSTSENTIVKSTPSNSSKKGSIEEGNPTEIPKDIEKLGGAKADDFNISEVVANYERLLIYAINNNDFSAVEAVLIPDSKLYNLQKKLVQNLYSKKVQEKLIEFNIEEIQKKEDEGIYKVFVNEKIGIKYSDKKVFETKEFNWIYTVEESNEKFALSDIQEWNRKK
jgi:uncharacterized membrane protein YvbJ